VTVVLLKLSLARKFNGEITSYRKKEYESILILMANHVRLKKNTCTISIPYALKVNLYIPYIRSKGIFQTGKPTYRRKLVPVVFYLWRDGLFIE